MRSSSTFPADRSPVRIPSTACSLALAACLVCAAAAPRDAAAQYGIRLARFNVASLMDDSTGWDRDYAIVFPQEQSREGALMWSCGDDSTRLVAAVRLPEEGAEGATRRAVWSIHGWAPDTSSLRGSAGSRVWFVDEADVDSLTHRVRQSDAMTLRIESAGAGEIEYIYMLAGADTALSSVACGAAADSAAPSGRETLRRLSRNPFRTADGWLDDDPYPVGWWPRLKNLSEFYHTLVRSYPPALRDAGVSGSVLLRFRVLEDGRVEAQTARVIRSTHPDFTPAALSVLQAMRFRPAVRNGRVTSVWATQPIEFRTAN